MPSTTKHLFKHVISEIGSNVLKNIPGLRRKPWMRPREMELICDILAALKPMRCLEFGAGYSSAFFSSKLPAGGRWYSLEHNASWFKTAHSLVDPKLAEVMFSTLSAEVTSPAFEGAHLPEVKTWLETASVHAPYDLILVDGGSRKAAIRWAASHLTEGGVMLLHDANRIVYHDALDVFAHKEYFLDYRLNLKGPDGGLAIASHRADNGRLADFSWYKELFKKADSLKTLSKIFNHKF